MATDLEIICIGNELLIGKTLNTNAYWLGKQATAMGANVTRVTVVQDIIAEIASAVNEALSRKPQFIITTGGLGPTFDDKTLEGIASALNRKVEVNPKAFAIVKERCEGYAQRHNLATPEMTPPRVKMAAIPQGSEPVNNPVGSAPGARLNIGSTVLFALPGVPTEMEAIFNESIAPLIRQAVGDRVFCEKSMFVDNLVEGNLAPLIDKVMTANAGVYIKSHVYTGPRPNQPAPWSHIEVHLTAAGLKTEKPSEKLQSAAEELAYLVRQHGGVVIVNG